MPPKVPKPFRPTAGHVVATVSVMTAAAVLIALFLVPVQSPWFWPLAGVFAAAAALGLLVPIGVRPGR